MKTLRVKIPDDFPYMRGKVGWTNKPNSLNSLFYERYYFSGYLIKRPDIYFIVVALDMADLTILAILAFKVATGKENITDSF